MKKITDFLLLALLIFITDIISTDILRLSSFWAFIFLFLALIIFEFFYFLFTQNTETITVSAKAKQIQRFSTINIIKATNNKQFAINNDMFIQWHAQKLNNQIRPGHTYKIKTYRLLFSQRNILSATEIKASIRKKSGKKSK